MDADVPERILRPFAAIYVVRVRLILTATFS